MTTDTLTRTEQRNQAILNDRLEKFNARSNLPRELGQNIPRVGDYIKYSDGSYSRITYYWDLSPAFKTNQIQAGGNNGSYYLSAEGNMSYSGGLDIGEEVTGLIESEEIKEGWIWFFSEDMHWAHNGINFRVKCKVWEFLPNEQE